MGQKVNPQGLRLGLTTDWKGKWFGGKDYATFLKEDIDIRQFLNKKLENAAISKIIIERKSNEIRIAIFTGRPGIVIGRRGMAIDKIRAEIEQMIPGKKVKIDIEEIKKPELDATLIAQNIAEQIISRVSFRRAMKRAVSSAMKGDIRGIRVSCSGRIGGAEIARTEWYREGRVPLHTLKADIDYGFAEANTKFGKIGIKVWIYRKDVEI